MFGRRLIVQALLGLIHNSKKFVPLRREFASPIRASSPRQSRFVEKSNARRRTTFGAFVGDTGERPISCRRPRSRVPCGQSKHHRGSVGKCLTFTVSVACCCSNCCRNCLDHGGFCFEPSRQSSQCSDFLRKSDTRLTPFGME